MTKLPHFRRSRLPSQPAPLLIAMLCLGTLAGCEQARPHQGTGASSRSDAFAQGTANIRGDTMDTNTMIEAEFMAYAHDQEQSDGWLTAPGGPPMTHDADTIAGPDTFAVVVRPDVPMRTSQGFAAFRASIVNTTRDTVVLDALDNRLLMVIQALDLTGRWRNIQDIPRTECGNSLHQLMLMPCEYWTFTVPCVHGRFPTRLRLALMAFHLRLKDMMPNAYGRLVPRDTTAPSYEHIFSNEFIGSVNAEQFEPRGWPWRELTLEYPLGK